MSIRLALLYTFSTRYFAMGLQLVATVILARLLSPEEIGVYSVGAAVIMIAHTLRDFGTSTYVIQERELTENRLGTAFTLTVIVAWVLALALWLASTPIGRFYGDARVAEVLAVMALNFALIPFGSISMALLRRAMNFRAIMFVTVASTVAQSGVSVLLAALSYGFISLAWGAVCGTLATALGSVIASARSNRYRPTFSDMRHVLAFSMRSSVSSIASEAGHSAPDIVLGRTVGMEGTGLFSRAMGYVQLLERVLQDVLRSVMLPYMAEVERSGENAKEKVIMVLDNVVSVSLFFIGLTAILAKPLVIVLYGKQWLEAVPLAYVLCPAIALRCVAPTLAASLVASGRITTVMRTSLISAILKFGCLAVFSLHGLLWGAVGFVAAEVVNVAVLLYFCNRSGMFPWASYVSIMTKNLPVAAAGMVPAIMAMIYVPIPVPLIEVMVYLGIVGSLSAIVWLATLAILDRPPKNEIVRLLVLIKARFG